MQKEIKNLNTKTDQVIGNMIFLSQEYDDSWVKIAKLQSENKTIIQDLSKLRESVKFTHKRRISTEEQIDALEQYGRLENLEINGIQMTNNENTNEIVKKVVKLLKVEVGDRDISTSHRLFNQQQTFGSHKFYANNNISSIIVPFANRDKRNEVYKKRRNFDISSFKEIFPNSIPENFVITENLTKKRKYLV